ncbi:hypothetical protein O181_089548 [Austropuccinia psidii MF-1]|uniref:Uncharacterized protein n=1 Tax=Austropuccinia psidii MF-1 TaxID=1389203 RepID=A0A9Q3ITG8_9BASI|nr:hypothetical protein [Austropuccinia psidii MF-1]
MTTLIHRAQVQSSNFLLVDVQSCQSNHFGENFLSLNDTCLRLLAWDISQSGQGFNLDSIHQLRNHQKSRLLQLAAEWHPLDNISLEALLPNFVHSDHSDETLDLESSFDPSNLKLIDISFSNIDLNQLSKSLFVPSSIHPFEKVSFTHLTTLILNNTRLITISNSLFNFLSNLPLSHLSLADQSLCGDLHYPKALYHLANATPNLKSINLSFNLSWLGNEIYLWEGTDFQVNPLCKVDWNSQWKKLDRLILIKSLSDRHSEYCFSSLVKVTPKTIKNCLKRLIKERLDNGVSFTLNFKRWFKSKLTCCLYILTQ